MHDMEDAPVALPPINSASSLLAQQPLQALPPVPDVSDSSGFCFGDLQQALLRSRQQAGGCGGLRRAVSAPHSMDALGWEPVLPAQQRAGAAPALGGPALGSPTYLQPSGGPMRRVGSSLGLRRSSSFFWTPAAHHDFERAINALSARGGEISAGNILSEMSLSHTAELKLADVDKHLRKKMLVHRRVLQQLSADRAGHGNLGGHLGGAPAPVPQPSPVAFNAHGGMGAAAAAGTAAASGSPGGSHHADTSPGCMRSGSVGGGRAGGGMAVVAEEPMHVTSSAASSDEPPPPSLPPPQLVAPPPAQSAAVAAAVAAQAVTDSLLAQQFQAQRLQHMQLAAAREALVAGEARLHE